MSALETSAFLWGDRHMPPSVVAEQAAALEHSGAVDYMSHTAQLGSFIPSQLWTEANAPMAQFLTDPDSLHDAYLMAAYTHHAAPSLGISILTDSLRSAPAPLQMMMYTFAHMTEGRALFHIGSGEQKHCRPFGYSRGQGLRRLEDLTRIANAFWENEAPFDFDGNHWTLRQASLGKAKPYRPQVLCMGSGPRLIDIATSHADGLSSTAPGAFLSPQHTAEKVGEIKGILERKGRDPEAFRFGLFVPALLHEDQAVVDSALDNDIVRWIAVGFGRIQREDWERTGLEPPTPQGWVYYKDLLPKSMDGTFVEDVLSKMTLAHTRSSYFHGSPQKVAGELSEYVEAGINFIGIVDYLPIIGTPELAAASLPRTIECLLALKAGVVSEARA